MMENKPQAKLAVLYANTDFGISLFNGIKNGFGTKADSTIVKALPINLRDSSVQFQIQALKNSKADMFFSIAAGKLAVPAMQQAYDSGWKPQLLVPFAIATDDEVFEKVGFEKIVGAISADIYKHPRDPRWKDDIGISAYKEFMEKYYPSGNVNNKLNVQGYFAGQLLVSILEKAGDNLTRENIMKIATHMDFSSADFPVLLPNIEIHTTPTDYELFAAMTLLQFDGSFWIPLKTYHTPKAP
jgi:branched-chain amino acid transport system substrate-binding protein